MAYPHFLEGTPLANGATTSAKNVVGTAVALDEFTRRILAVPHSEIKAQLDAEKAAKGTSKPSASRRASRPKP
jgi:hypothetical protein